METVAFVDETTTTTAEKDNAKEYKPYTCCVCCDAFDKVPVNCCGAEHGRDMVCSGCLTDYINSVVASAPRGTCPQIMCPQLCHVEAKKKRGLLYRYWSDAAFFPDLALATSAYDTLAKTVTQYMCSHCHRNTHLVQPYRPNDARRDFIQQFGLEKRPLDEPAMEQFLDKLKEQVQAYVDGKLDVEAFHQEMCVMFPTFLGPQEEEVAIKRNIFYCRRILQMMNDPERQTTYMLRHVRDQPLVRSTCCDHMHCFRCKTRPHTGKSCTEYLATLQEDVLPCPFCSVPIWKTDGCDSVTCVCNMTFSWRDRKDSIRGCQEFLQLFPQDTDFHSLRLAFVARKEFGNQFALKQWLQNHRGLLFPRIRAGYNANYGLRYSIDQLCALRRLLNDRVPLDLPVGVELVLEDYDSLRRTPPPAGPIFKLVAYRLEDIRKSVNSIFHTFYRTDRDRFLASTDTSGKYLLPGWLLQESMKQHRSERTSNLSRSQTEEHLRRHHKMQCLQFLGWIYGTYPFFRFQPKFAPQHVTCWDPVLSNPDILVPPEIEGGPFVALRRVNSAGVVPAAQHVLPAPYSVFEVVLTTAATDGNAITFGLCLHAMGKNNGDGGGVGLRTNSWGLCNERDIGSNRSTYFGEGVGGSMNRFPNTFRSLQQGDRLKAVVMVEEGLLVLSINDTAAVQEFVLPEGHSYQEYYFAATMANENVLTIVQPSAEQLAAETRIKEGSSEYNRFFHPEHSTRLMAARSTLRKKLMSLPQSLEGQSFFVGPFSSEWSCIRQQESGDSFLLKCAAKSVSPLVVAEAMAERLCGALSCKKEPFLAFLQECQKVATTTTAATTTAQSLPTEQILQQAEEAVIAATDNEFSVFLQSHSKGAKRKAREQRQSAQDKVSKLQEVVSAAESVVESLTWCDMFCAVDYLHGRGRTVRHAALESKAKAFEALHGASACFFAAMTLQNHYSKQPTELSEEEQQAYAFQQFFSAEMQQWYEDDKASRDPLIYFSSKHSQTHCRCLPRHSSCRCPHG